MRAFVLGGGGNRGAYEVGMLEALVERGIHPDFVVGTSIGAVNGAAIAADPTIGGAHRLADHWLRVSDDNPFELSLWRTAATALRSRTHLIEPGPAEEFVRSIVGVERIEDLRVPFATVAACIESSTEEWFTEGPVVDAVMASAALPGVFPPRVIDGKHYLDGGLVNSIPVERAIERGAKELFVLQVGHISEPLEPPSNPFELAMVAFEVSRRHRFLGEIAAVPEEVTVHVLPTGEEGRGSFNDPAKLKVTDTSSVRRRIERAHEATHEYLKAHGYPLTTP